MRKLLALGLAMMMVMALSSVALADPPGDCEVTFTVLKMDNTPYDNAILEIQDYTGPGETGADNTYVTILQQGRHYDVRVQGGSAPEEGFTKFYTGNNTTMAVTIYMLYDAHGEGDTTRVLFEVTDAIGVTLHAHQEQVSIRALQTDFAPVQFNAQVDHGGFDEIYEGKVTAFTKDGDGDWVVAGWGVAGNELPQSGEIAFKFSPDEVGTYVQFEPSGHTLPGYFNNENWNQDFWLKGITNENTPANTMGNIYFKLTVTLE